MKRETKCMFLIIAPHNEELAKCRIIARLNTMFLIIAPHNEERN